MGPQINDEIGALFYFLACFVGFLTACLIVAGGAGAGALLLAKLRGQDTAPIWRIIRQEWNGKTDAGPGQ